MISPLELRELFDYHEDGYLLRTDSPKHDKRYVNKKEVRGCVHRTGNLVVTLRGKQYPLRSLIWAWHTGKWPKKLEYIDGNRLNTKIENLREYKSVQGEKVTQAILRRLFCYDIDTGELRWLKSKGGVRKGRVAGDTAIGYRRIVVNGIPYMASHLVLLYLENTMPDEDHTVDHIDRNRDNNRRENLRIVSHRVQQINRGRNKHSKTGITGVSPTKDGTYRVYICDRGKNRRVGSNCSDFREAVYRRYHAEQALGWHELNKTTPAKEWVERDQAKKK